MYHASRMLPTRLNHQYPSCARCCLQFQHCKLENDFSVLLTRKLPMVWCVSWSGSFRWNLNFLRMEFLTVRLRRWQAAGGMNDIRKFFVIFYKECCSVSPWISWTRCFPLCWTQYRESQKLRVKFFTFCQWKDRVVVKSGNLLLCNVRCWLCFWLRVWCREKFKEISGNLKFPTVFQSQMQIVDWINELVLLWWMK